MEYKEYQRIKQIAESYIEHMENIDKLVEQLKLEKIQMDVGALDLMNFLNDGINGLIVKKNYDYLKQLKEEHTLHKV